MILSGNRDVTIDGRSGTIKVEIKRSRSRSSVHVMSSSLSENTALKRRSALQKLKLQTSTERSSNQNIGDLKKRAAFFGDKAMLRSLRSRPNPSFRHADRAKRLGPSDPIRQINDLRSQALSQQRSDNRLARPVSLSRVKHTVSSLQTRNIINGNVVQSSSIPQRTSSFPEKKIQSRKAYPIKSTKSKLRPIVANNNFGKQILGKLDSEEDFSSIDLHLNRNERYKKSKKKPKNVGKLDKVTVFNGMFAQGLSTAMSVSVDDILDHGREIGLDIEKSSVLDAESAGLIVESFGRDFIKKAHPLDKMSVEYGDIEGYKYKPPVVSVIGHVDHGKTSLLDRIRSSNILEKESGGITQGIGAYQVYVGSRMITFIDTPGHEVFMKMRSNGISATDIVLLVIAADSGIQDQTIESINHIKVSKSFFIVVITKCDIYGADVDRIRKSLVRYDIVVESLGGDIPEIQVSAKTGANINDLLNLILDHSEILELKANPSLSASGIILESSIDKAVGSLITVIIKNGTLRRGDHFVADNYYGKVRLINDSDGKILEEAVSGQAVRVLGATGLPNMGSDFVVMSEKDAKLVVNRKHEITSFTSLMKSGDKRKYTFVDILKSLSSSTDKKFNFIIKADSIGSREALVEGISKIEFKNFDNGIIAKSVGPVNESDVMLAKTTNASVIAFRVSVSSQVNKLANMHSVRINRYDVVYKIFETLNDEINNLIKPKEIESSVGYAEVVAIFTKPKLGNIAGCFVREGYVKVGFKCIVFRGGKQVYASKIVSLKRKRDDKNIVSKDEDCGIVIEKFDDFKIGDFIECFTIKSLE